MTTDPTALTDTELDAALDAAGIELEDALHTTRYEVARATFRNLEIEFGNRLANRSRTNKPQRPQWQIDDDAINRRRMAKAGFLDGRSLVEPYQDRHGNTVIKGEA